MGRGWGQARQHSVTGRQATWCAHPVLLRPLPQPLLLLCGFRHLLLRLLQRHLQVQMVWQPASCRRCLSGMSNERTPQPSGGPATPSCGATQQSYANRPNAARQSIRTRASSCVLATKLMWCFRISGLRPEACEPKWTGRAERCFLMEALAHAQHSGLSWL